MSQRAFAFLLLFTAAATAARAACVNRFTGRSEGSKQIVTLLTGKLTFQEAQALAAAIRDRRAEPLEWVGEDGKPIGRQYGELKIVRPMPVACDSKPSGVVMIGTFISPQKPARKMNVKIDAKTTVVFDQQP